MNLLATVGSFMMGGSSGFFIVFVLPIVLLVGVLWLCKIYKFSILPSDLQGKPPQPFKFPKLTREKHGRAYKWNIADFDTSDIEEHQNTNIKWEVETKSSNATNIYD